MFKYITIHNGQKTVREQDARLTLEEMQAVVGGYIELFQSVPVSRTLHIDCYCNEEGKIRNLPVNVYWPAGQDMIRGDILIVGGDPTTGETVSLPEDADSRVHLVSTGVAIRDEQITVTPEGGSPSEPYRIRALLVDGNDRRGSMQTA